LPGHLNDSMNCKINRAWILTNNGMVKKGIKEIIWR
jgi:hypothetical protein